MTAEEKKAMLEALLREWGVEYSFYSPDNITEQVVIIKNYKPTGKTTPSVSYALPVTDYYTGAPLENRCWMSHKNIKPVNAPNQRPNYHKNYQEFEYVEVTFYPFSVDFQETGGLQNLPSIKEICHRLYNDLDFDKQA